MDSRKALQTRSDAGPGPRSMRSRWDNRPRRMTSHFWTGSSAGSRKIGESILDASSSPAGRWADSWRFDSPASARRGSQPSPRMRAVCPRRLTAGQPSPSQLFSSTATRTTPSHTAVAPERAPVSDTDPRRPSFKPGRSSMAARGQSKSCPVSWICARAARELRAAHAAPEWNSGRSKAADTRRRRLQPGALPSFNSCSRTRSSEAAGANRPNPSFLHSSG